MVSPSPDQLSWQVRIAAHDGVVVGGGVVVSDSRVLTCAHVVNFALRRGRDVGGSHPRDPVTVLAHSSHPLQVNARVETWDFVRDTATLELEAVLPHEPARLRAIGHEFRASATFAVCVLGYPWATTHGIAAHAEAVGYGGDRRQRVQLNIDTNKPVRFDSGFSGCGVVDLRDGSVVGIVISALAGGERGALGDLGGTVGLMEPVEMVSALQGHLVDTEREKVHDLLLAVPFEETRKHYWAATRHREAEVVSVSSAWNAFTDLRNLPPRGSDGLPCDIVYIEEIARDGLIAPDALRAYSDSRPRDEVPPRALAALRKSPAPEPPGKPSLVVLAEPLPGEADTQQSYQITHWFGDGERFDKKTPFRIPEDHMRSSVLQIIDQAEAFLEQCASESPMLLELVLPLSLVTLPIAHWRLPAPLTDTGERIGSSYEIVVHVYERLHDPGWERIRRKTAVRWRELRTTGKGRLYCVPPDADVGAGVELQDHLAGGEIVCCVLGGAVDHGQGMTQLAVALQAGIPGVVWLQGGGLCGSVFRDVMKTLCHDNDAILADDLARLPHTLLEWRTKKNERDFGCDPYDVIAVLDDMDRVRGLSHAGILTSPRRETQ